MIIQDYKLKMKYNNKAYKNYIKVLNSVKNF